MLDPVTTLQQLIALPSVNPMGRAVDGPIYFERRVTDYLAAKFADWAIPFERHEVHLGRENLIARLESDPSRPTLMLEVHQDTVPVEGMTIDPFAGELRDGRIYGRGACDVKGAMACILSVVDRLVAERPAGMPNLVLAFAVNEEHGFTGAQQLARLWRSGESKLLPQRPDAILVSEPTELNVVVAHKGVVRWKSTTHGRAAHSSAPEKGDNAIYRMAHVIDALETYARDIGHTHGEHPLLGRPTLSVGTIAGGISVNTVPDTCMIEIDRRLLPGEDPQFAHEHVIAHVQSALGEAASGVEHEKPFIVARGLKDEINGSLANQLITATEQCGVTSRPIGVPFGTDASAFSAEVPTVIFGPGSVAQAHTKDEWIAVEQLHQATKLLHQFCSTAM